MNIIKKIGLTVVTLSLLCAGNADAQSVTVVTHDGQKHSYNTSDIKEMVFYGASEANIIKQGDYKVEISDITSSSVKMAVTPDDNSIRYYFDISSRATYDKYGVEALVEDYFQSLIETYPSIPLSTFLDAALSQGADSDEIKGLPSDTEMVAYAVGVNDRAQCVGEATVVTFRTLPGGDPSQCTFDIEILDVASDAVYFNIYPSDNSVKYWAGVCSVDLWPGDKAMPIDVQSACRELAEETGMQYEHIIEAVSFKGPLAPYDESGLQNDTRYYIYCYAWDNQGNALTDITKVMFTTNLYDYSEADLKLSYRYFNCDDLIAAYPDKFGSNLAGRVLVQTSFTLNEAAVHYAWALGSANYMDEEMYPEETTKNAILAGGYVDRAPDLYANWGEATYLYFASDYYGFDGKLNRLKVDFKKENASPASAYNSSVISTTGKNDAPLKLAPRSILGKRSAISLPLRDGRKIEMSRHSVTGLK